MSVVHPSPRVTVPMEDDSVTTVLDWDALVADDDAVAAPPADAAGDAGNDGATTSRLVPPPVRTVASHL